MKLSNTIETSRIVNVVSFKVDNNSYKRALNAIRKISSEWSRATSKMSGAMAQGRAIGGGGVRPSGSPRRQFVGPPEFKAGKNTRQQMKQQASQQRNSNRVANTIATASIGRDPSFIKSYASQIGILNQQLKAGVITSAQYNKHLNSMARDFRNAQNSAGGLLSTAKELRSAFVALTATYTAFAGGKAIMTTGQMFQGIEAGMNMASTDANAAAQQIQFLREEAYRLGLDLKIAAQGFTQMSVAGKEILKPTEIQSLFTGLSEYSTALGVDSFRYEKAVLAIGQMLN